MGRGYRINGILARKRCDDLPLTKAPSGVGSDAFLTTEVGRV
jgi:hypothetical protein